MNHKVKSTMTGILVALSFVTTSGLLGQEPVATNVEPSPANIAYVADLDVMDASQEASKAHDKRLRRQLSMPYFSFSRVLPKQGL
ncbi:MAG TPA: hypothetical protein PLF92_03525 [Arenimonas sp.]|jgi:hypothetical protein|nr:hypothetical protein [Arenimonas sp.]HPW31955.1 hypothetical protein [Arenimonas sp.]